MIILGPFIGHTTADSAKIWLHAPNHKRLYVRYGIWSKDGVAKWKTNNAPLEFREEQLECATITLSGLVPDTIYSYQICRDSEGRDLVDLEGLHQDELYFRTLPPDEVMEKQRLDFLIMSCHNPDKGGGYQVWETLPQIIQESSQSDEGKSWIRFALLGGDQVYADDWEERLLKASTEQERIHLYLEVYRHFWSNLAYRKVLCKLPAYLMWDDHDITDGWGSREDSFEGSGTAFKTEWMELFRAAKQTFQQFQSSRNPNPLSPHGNDIAFRVGTAGFVLADLRTHRNARQKQIWKKEQFQAIRDWVASQPLTSLFFLSPVVFSHEEPKLTKSIYKLVPWALNFFRNQDDFFRQHPYRYWISLICAWSLLLLTAIQLSGLLGAIACLLLALLGIISNAISRKSYIAISPPCANRKFMESAGDLRDDIDDAWSSDKNAASAEEILKYFFDLQNQKDLQVVILSGDIHAAGYSTIHSLNRYHEKRSVIPHIVSSPVGYAPFSWILEAIYRARSKNVDLGTSGKFFAQISHHFTRRNVAVISIRPEVSGQILKVKYYVEGFPEPQIMVFDLGNSSHLEKIKWKESSS